MNPVILNGSGAIAVDALVVLEQGTALRGTPVDGDE